MPSASTVGSRSAVSLPWSLRSIFGSARPLTRKKVVTPSFIMASISCHDMEVGGEASPPAVAPSTAITMPRIPEPSWPGMAQMVS